jgi:hypothetical protein
MLNLICSISKFTSIRKHVELISTWILAEIWRHNFGRRGEGTNSTRLLTPTRDCYMHVFLVKYKTLVTPKTVNSLRVFIFDISDKIWSSEMNEINAYKWQNMRSTIIRLLVKYRSSLEALVPRLVKVKVKFQYLYRRRFFNSNKPGQWPVPSIILQLLKWKNINYQKMRNSFNSEIAIDMQLETALLHLFWCLSSGVPFSDNAP